MTLSPFFPLLLLLALVAGIALLLLSFPLHNPRHSVRQNEALVTWRLVLPRQPQFDATQAAGWFAALVPLLPSHPPFLTVEIVAENGALSFALTAPRTLEATLQGHLSVRFPGTRLERMVSSPVTAATQMMPFRLRHPDLLPVLTSDDLEGGGLLPVLSALPTTRERCGLRITFGAGPGDWSAWAHRALAALETGQAIPGRSPVGKLGALTAEVLSAFRPSGGPVRPPQIDPHLLRAIKAKVQGPVYTTHLAIWSAAPDASHDLAALGVQAEHAFRNPAGNGLVAAGTPRPIKTATDLDTGPTLILTAAELGRLFHLPAAAVALFAATPSHQVAPPVVLTAEQGNQQSVHTRESERTRLGEALTGAGTVPFGLTSEERRLHTYVVGKTGTGKSTLLAGLMHQDLVHHQGFGLIDPHGDLAERVLALVPPARQEQVLYFNPADRDYPVGFNLLARTTPERRPLVASSVLGVFKKLYGDSWGPRLEHFLRNSILLLLEAPCPSLLLLPRLLTDRSFRAQILPTTQDPVLRRFFRDEFESYDPRWRAEALSPILNKVGQFLASPVIRHVVGQREPGFSLRQVMDAGGIFIANLSTGRIGEDNADLLGGLLVAGFQQAALARADLPEADRRDFYLYVDEFQHFANDSFASILSEARKYHLSLTLGHQYLSQVSPAMLEAVLGNVGSLLVFRVGAGDTPRLVRELAPQFDGEDLVHLPNHHFCARITQNGLTLPAFSAKTILPPEGTADVSDLIAGARRRYARPRAEVEIEIADHFEARGDPAG